MFVSHGEFSWWICHTSSPITASACGIAGPRSVVICVVFFFQAEDGIRDTSVTGVQTCALPISTLNYVRAQLASGLADLHSPLNWNLGHVRSLSLQTQYQRIVDSITDSLRFMKRSEERRVGKESRYRWWTPK